MSTQVQKNKKIKCKKNYKEISENPLECKTPRRLTELRES